MHVYADRIGNHNNLHLRNETAASGRQKRSAKGNSVEDDIRIVGGYEPARRPFMAYIELYKNVGDFGFAKPVTVTDFVIAVSDEDAEERDKGEGRRDLRRGPDQPTVS